MRHRSAASSRRNGLSLAREGLRRVMSRSYHLPWPGMAHRDERPCVLPSGWAFQVLVECVEPELVIANHLAGLDGVAIVELLAAAALRLEMFRLLLPCLQGILVREADQIDLLAVLARVGLDRNESGNPLDEFVHAPGCLPVRFRVRSVPQMGREDDDDFGGILYATIRHVSPLRPLRDLYWERRGMGCPLRPASPAAFHAVY